MDILLICADDHTPPALLAVNPGRGATVLCAPDAAQAAQWLYPDRRIEARALYQEPRTRARLWRWMLKAGPEDETAELVKRRVIDTAVRLTQVAKSDGETALVAGPRLLRLVGFKLGAIGWRGGQLRGWRPGQTRRFSYGA